MAGKSAAGAADKAELVLWLFENSRDLMHVITADGRFKLINPAWTRLTGWTEADLVGKPVFDFVHPDDADEMNAHVGRLMQSGESENLARARMKDGSWRWLAGRSQRTPDGLFISTLHDATREREQAQELEDARRTRKMLGASAGIGIWAYDPSEKELWWSDELAEIIGVDPADYRKEDDFAQLLPPGDWRRLRKMLLRAVLTGQSTQVEHRVWAMDRWLTMRATMHGEPRGDGRYVVKGISEDISELADARDAARRSLQQVRKARRELQVNARRLKLALEAAEAGVYEIDHVARTFWCSPEFERLTGRAGSSYDEAIELSYPGFHPEDLEHVRASFRALHRGETTSGESFEARIIRPDGEERWVRLYHHLKIGRGGRWLKAVGLIQDCDARKRQELALVEAERAAQSAAEAKAAFLANMSHEIRTPLNGVMGVLHLLKSEKLSADGASLLTEALSCGQMLNELLNDVIDFSKIEAGRLELAYEPVDPKALIEGVVRLLKPQAQAKGLQLIVDAPCSIGWVRSDPVRLRQALFNLVGNAVKFTEKGHVVVRCKCGEPGVLRLEVEDTGVGIPAAAQARLFQRFNQADASTTRKFGGSGLGLAITKRLAEMMSGDVGFTSAEGRGSTFWLEVAVEPAEAAAAAPEVAQTVLDGLRVLVVEDNSTNRLIATKLLENLGASVETAADGYLGVEAAARGGFDLILMDVQMPGIDGLEAARRIRKLGGAPAATPIVALTANVLSHQRQAYLEAGMDGVVGKPISPAALLAEIARLSSPSPAAADTAVA